MITVESTLNPLEVLVVEDHYRNRGIEHYELRQGNCCIWATHGQISEYFIFKDGLLVDIQVD